MDEEIPEWEQEDEKPPEHLERKWEAEERGKAAKVVCESCGRHVDASALLCLYCGESTGVRTGIFSQMRHFFLKSPVGFLAFFGILLAILLFFAL